MAKRTTPSDKVVIDPLFGIPEGAEDQFVYSEDEYFYDDETYGDLLTEESLLEIEYEDYIEYDDGYDDQDDLALDTPEDFQIISQTLRRGPGGQQVVDIVIQVEDIAGATNYEIQVTKV